MSIISENRSIIWEFWHNFKIIWQNFKHWWHYATFSSTIHQGLAGIAPGRPETAKNVKKTP